jgi:uroporphyrin-3 C-methyltransferase
MMVQSDIPPPPTSVHSPWATRGALAVVAVLLAIALLVAWLGNRQAQQELRTTLTRDVAAATAASTSALAQQAETAAALRDAQAKLALLEARLAESQSQQAVLETFYRDISPARDDLTLTEAEQGINLAAQQLALAGNVQSALVALQLADNKLAHIERPRFAPLRRALASDMDRLKMVPYVDVGALAARIDTAIAAVDTLPLARDERLAARVVPPMPSVAQPAWRQALGDAWSHMRELVRIESSDRPAAPLLLPSEEYFLRENLRLRLLSARNALLARNDSSFKSDVRAADAWIQKFFDTRAKPVQGVLATLAQLVATPMPAALPDLAQSLAAVTALRATQDRLSAQPRGAPAPVAATPR